MKRGACRFGIPVFSEAGPSYVLGIPINRAHIMESGRATESMITDNLCHYVAPDLRLWAKLVDGRILVTLGHSRSLSRCSATSVQAPAISSHVVTEPIEIILLVVALNLLPGLVANLIVWAADGFSERACDSTPTGFVGIFIWIDRGNGSRPCDLDQSGCAPPRLGDHWRFGSVGLPSVDGFREPSTPTYSQHHSSLPVLSYPFSCLRICLPRLAQRK